MRITLDLIEKSTSFINALKERELDIRGNKVSAIENLGTTHDQYDAIDLSDNEIKSLENFPLLKRLKSLYLSNNRISKIDCGLEKSLPGLECLILSHNALENLNDITPLKTLISLQTLSLVDNPVTKKKGYRLFIIYHLPFLRALDFQKVKDQERKSATAQFSNDSHIVEHGVTDSSSAGRLTLEQTKRIKDAIEKASSLDEIKMLEKALAMGHIPEGV